MLAGGIPRVRFNNHAAGAAESETEMQEIITDSLKSEIEQSVVVVATIVAAEREAGRAGTHVAAGIEQEWKSLYAKLEFRATGSEFCSTDLVGIREGIATLRAWISHVADQIHFDNIDGKSTEPFSIERILRTTAERMRVVEVELSTQIAGIVSRMLDQLRPDFVRCYSGRPGCCCGCRGKHTDSTRSISSLASRMRKTIASGRYTEVTWHGKPGEMPTVLVVETTTRTNLIYTTAWSHAVSKPRAERAAESLVASLDRPGVGAIMQGILDRATAAVNSEEAAS